MENIDLQYPIYDGDNNIRWVHVLGKKIYDDSGIARVAVGTVKDITDFIEMRDRSLELQSLSKNYRSVFRLDLVRKKLETVFTEPDIEKWISEDGDVYTSISNLAENIIEESYQSEFLVFTDPATIQSRLRHRDSISFIFRSKLDGWVKGSLIRVGDSEPIQKVLFAAEVIDDQLQTREELLKTTDALDRSHRQILAADAVIKALTKDYHTIWVVDKLTGKMRLVRSESLQNKIQNAVSMVSDFNHWDEPLQLYVQNYVMPEDRERMAQALRFDEIMKQLEISEPYQINFHQKRDDDTISYQQVVFYNADVKDGAKQFVCAFKAIDDQK